MDDALEWGVLINGAESAGRLRSFDKVSVLLKVSPGKGSNASVASRLSEGSQSCHRMIAGIAKSKLPLDFLYMLC